LNALAVEVRGWFELLLLLRTPDVFVFFTRAAVFAGAVGGGVFLIWAKPPTIANAMAATANEPIQSKRRRVAGTRPEISVTDMKASERRRM
jgi:hypothetical protein